MPLSRMNSAIVLPDLSHSSIQQLLSDQYHCTEEYCNATTALHNTILEQQQQAASSPATDRSTTSNEVSRAVKLRSSIDRYQVALTKVQNNVYCLEQLVLSIVEKKKQLMDSKIVDSSSNNDHDVSSSLTFLRLLNVSILQDHLQRTYRILRSIYTFGEGTSYHNNGIMTPKAIETQQGKINVKLVALASLRASNQIVKESLPP